MRARSLLLVGLTACTGMSLGENKPGDDTWVDPPTPVDGAHTMGAIAIESDEDRLWVVHEAERDGQVRSHLTSIEAGSGRVTEVMDVSDTFDRRVIFPSPGRMLLMAQTDDEREHLVLFDTASKRVLRHELTDTWYWGTRRSPSGRLVMVADNAASGAPLHLISTTTLEHRVIEHEEGAIEAQWNHDSDRLLVVTTEDPFGEHPISHLRRYDLGQHSVVETLPVPDIDVTLPGVDWDFWFSFTWVAVSPDDRWAVFPMRRGPGNVLEILDQESGQVREVPGKGPVGFTGDGAWIVSYQDDGTGGQDLLLVRPDSLEQKVVPLGFAGVSFFPMRDSNVVLVTSLGEERPALVDVDTGVVTELADDLRLWDFVSLPGQLWLADGGELLELDVAAASVTAHDASMRVQTLNVTPGTRRLALGDEDHARIRRYDTVADCAGPEIALPDPWDSTPLAGLPDVARAKRQPEPSPRRLLGAQSALDPAYRRLAPLPGAVAMP